MKIDDVRRTAYSMPLTSPSFPPGPYRFFNREFFVITYRTDPEALSAVVPEPLERNRWSNTSSSVCRIPPALAITPKRAK
jgi:acetoacetate decarboxylase